MSSSNVASLVRAVEHYKHTYGARPTMTHLLDELSDMGTEGVLNAYAKAIAEGDLKHSDISPGW